MTEEIIIDGVDVAGCYADKKKMKDGLYCFWEGGNCEYNKYCYFKQLKRLEQENKELKEENIKVKKEFNNLIAEIISDIEYTGEITCNGESPKEHLHQMQKALAALEEIQKIIKSYDLAVDNGVSVDTLYTIGTIINEVLG